MAQRAVSSLFNFSRFTILNAVFSFGFLNSVRNLIACFLWGDEHIWV